MKQKVTVFWFRRDLRLNDNAGLYNALQSVHPVLCLFIFDKNILNKLGNKHDARVLFIHRQLELLNHELKKTGSSLVTIYDDPVSAWKTILHDYDVCSAYTNHDYEPYANERDSLIQKLMNENNINFHTFKDQVIFEKSDVVKENGQPYTVFTPYKNKYFQILKPLHYVSFRNEKYFNNFVKTKFHKVVPLSLMGFEDFDIKFPGSSVQKQILKKYSERRDFPSLDGTSRLSVHLRFGTVSIRELFSLAISEKSEAWLNELVWRDFYQMILFNFPHVTKSAFKPGYNKIPWRNNEDEFQKWCEGNTGYPFVDAGMRELNNTGFMHNRLRMITASFLVKHLLIDWRWGEAYFAEKLLDFDLAANNGGWQWAAGSGCDAAPYFRIFNPYEQTKRFDQDFEYIRKWVPEYDQITYPRPIVEHTFARNRCLDVFKRTLGNLVSH